MRRTVSKVCAVLMLTMSVVPFGSVAETAAPQTEIRVIKRPRCGCCERWVTHLKAHGFKTTVTESRQLSAIRVQLGVPKDLAACHTAQVEGYIIEGHVPAHAIRRLLTKRPNATGLAVPGMPVGSPGMEGGAPETYDVILFSKDRKQSFGQYKTDKPVSH